MKSLLTLTVALLAAAVCSGSPAAPAAPAKLVAGNSPDKIAGDYVEVRTASVFAGACHYNGEVVTTGRDAIMAWNFTAGVWQGTDLAGVRAMAAVTSDESLGNEHAARKVELIVDTAATDAQANAVAGLLRERSGDRLGTIVTTRRAPVTFEQKGHEYTVKSDGFGSMSVTPMPDAACCKQPNLVWYTPLTPLDHRKVGTEELVAQWLEQHVAPGDRIFIETPRVRLRPEYRFDYTPRLIHESLAQDRPDPIHFRRDL